MLTDPGALVLDPFAGSCVTGEVCERLKRNWICVESQEEFIRGAIGRFGRAKPQKVEQPSLFLMDMETGVDLFYRVARPGALWNGNEGEPLAEDGGQERRIRQKVPIATK